MKASYKKILTMYGASILAIVFGFLVSIFNSRVLGPEGFGDYKFIETVARFIASLVSVGFFISISRLLAINTSNLEKKKYIGLFTIIFFATSVLGIFIFLGFSYFQPYFFDNNLSSTIRMNFFIVLVILGHLALAEILKGLHHIYTISIISVLPSVAYLISAYIARTYLNIEINAEIVLFLYYGILLITLLIVISGLKPNFKYEKQFVRNLLKENKYNGRPIYYGSLAGVATTHIAGLSISYFMNNSQVGFFMLALTVCGPLLVIPSVLGTIFFKQFATIKHIPKKVFYFSTLGTAFALLIFYLFIDIVIVTFYDTAYLEVANISKYLILGFIFHGFGDLVNRFLGAKGQGKLLRNAAYFVGVMNILGYTLLIKFFGINGAILTKILASGLYFCIMLYYYHRFVKENKI
ncbi:oligosaccharide flippase family protein [Zobellia nedashkovskayae]|uniref:oligosaccharide flippase family protein n=1 Tax=Zobellia nedashkovskayae TaxID=2779510 RepID=UPI00188A0229|nr:oligosaccharide flippase family protein [Zobellia nedashkovskayae]